MVSEWGLRAGNGGGFDLHPDPEGEGALSKLRELDRPKFFRFSSRAQRRDLLLALNPKLET
ncbi:MAG: hypothetical protein JWN45_3253 [Acidobacteriaceae bacterium]|nr:hypothetical protein [Acidobacteriaceae bacterium]